MKLDIDKVKSNAMATPHVRETLGNQADNIPMPPPTRFVRVELDEKRNSIRELDNQLTKIGPKL